MASYIPRINGGVQKTEEMTRLALLSYMPRFSAR
jgi:hypothetical protein